MSLTTFDHPFHGLLDQAGRSVRRRRRRAPVRAWLSYWARAAVWWTWMALHVASVGLARLVNWFADDPRRVRVALGGTAVCISAGAAVGVGVGWVLAEAITLAIDVVWAAQG